MALAWLAQAIGWWVLTCLALLALVVVGAALNAAIGRVREQRHRRRFVDRAIREAADRKDRTPHRERRGNRERAA